MFDYDDYREYNGDPTHDIYVDDFYVDDASEYASDEREDDDPSTGLMSAKFAAFCKRNAELKKKEPERCTIFGHEVVRGSIRWMILASMAWLKEQFRYDG
jgi:hypothetical protein